MRLEHLLSRDSRLIDALFTFLNSQFTNIIQTRIIKYIEDNINIVYKSFSLESNCLKSKHKKFFDILELIEVVKKIDYKRLISY